MSFAEFTEVRFEPEKEKERPEENFKSKKWFSRNLDLKQNLTNLKKTGKGVVSTVVSGILFARFPTV